MTPMPANDRILMDAREFVGGRFTGIARVLEGLTDALAAREPSFRIFLAMQDAGGLPPALKNRPNIQTVQLPGPFLQSEHGSGVVTIRKGKRVLEIDMGRP